MKTAFLGGTQLSGANFTNADLNCSNSMNSANMTSAIWNNTTCPDGTNGDNDGGTCVGHL